ncbi:MAG: hypothetical protein MI892_21270, partial [Desulfobacterales bacterium]|nr:hypothetical protein [Desulfobacterales bacterium]
MKDNGFFFNAWIQGVGRGWTGKQVQVAYLFSVIFPAAIVAVAKMSGLGWSAVQTIVAALIAWDLCGGLIGYTHSAMKRRTAKERGTLWALHHNLQHIHPLMLVFFDNPTALLCITGYWLVSFVLYLILMEIDPNTGHRRISASGEKTVVAMESVIAGIIIAIAFLIPGIPVS